ncbi:MAG: Ig-like domain-containing protein [Snowella sp.]|nr:Ig-like domain-containing protein [Snowella sp.]
MTSSLPQSPVAEFPQDPIEQEKQSTRWLRYVMPAILVIFTSLLFGLTYTFQHSCSPLVGPLPQACYIDRVTIQPDHLEPLVRGKKKQLIAKVELKKRPKNDKTKFTKAVDWKSTHPEFVAIDSKGVLIARMPGETEIIATSRENPDKWAMVKVKVEPKPIVTKIEFQPNELSGYDGEQLSLDKDFFIDIQGERNFDKTVKYESNNPQIVDVDPLTNANSAKLKIKLKSVGETYITAISIIDPKQKGSMKIKVFPPQLESIQIEPSSLTLQPSKTKKLKITFEGKGAFDQTVIWSSEDEKIAEVNSDGTVLAKEEGTAIISAVSKVDRNIKSFIGINVQENEENQIITKGVPGLAGGVCLVVTTSMVVPPPLSVPMCGAFAGAFYWLLNH